MPEQCPHCRGDLVNNTTHGVWIVVFSTLTTTAEDLETDTFKLAAVLNDGTTFEKSLDQIPSVESGKRHVFTWTLTSRGKPMSAFIEVHHGTLGTLHQDLTVSE